MSETKSTRTIVSLSITAAAGTPSEAKLGEGATDHQITVLVAGVQLVANGPELDDIAAVGAPSTVIGTVTLVGGEVSDFAGDIRGVTRGDLDALLDEVHQTGRLADVEAAIVKACATPGEIQEVTF